jgi:hypothetical protein
MQVHIATPAEIETLKNIMRPAFNDRYLSITGKSGTELLQLVEDM